MVWSVNLTEISPRKPCYDGSSAVTEKALGAGSSLRAVSHILSHQHTQTGTKPPTLPPNKSCLLIFQKKCSFGLMQTSCEPNTELLLLD